GLMVKDEVIPGFALVKKDIVQFLVTENQIGDIVAFAILCLYTYSSPCRCLSRCRGGRSNLVSDSGNIGALCKRVNRSPVHLFAQFTEFMLQQIIFNGYGHRET